MGGISKELMDIFYDLADFEEQKRHNAVRVILHELETGHNAVTYCMRRLVAGLASSRAAARLGYTNALSVILAYVANEWPATELFKLADEKLPLNGTENQGSALGQHLLHLAMVNSDAYNDVSSEIAIRELGLVEKQRGLSYSSSDLLARCANRLEQQKFAEEFWPLVKKEVMKPLTSVAPEWFHFALQIMDRHSNTLKTEVSFISADDKLCISDDDCEKVLNIVKKTNGCAENELILNLLLLARTAGIFDSVYSKIIEKWLYCGDLHKAISRALPFINFMIQQIDFQTDELVIIFSSEFVHMVRSVRTSNEFRFMHSTIEAVLLALKEVIFAHQRFRLLSDEKRLALKCKVAWHVSVLCEVQPGAPGSFLFCLQRLVSLVAKEWATSDIVALLRHFDSVEGGNFDEFIGGNIKITEKILVQLHDDVHEVVFEALKVGGWRLRRIASTFSHWPAVIQESILKLFFKKGTWTEEIRNAFCSCIASLFTVSVRAGRNVTVIYKAEHEKVLRKFIKKHAKDIELPSIDDRNLAAFTVMLALWIITTPNLDERRSYSRDFAEAVTLCEKLAEDNSNVALTVLNDLLLSLLSRPHRYHRAITHFVFASFIPRMKLENLLHIFETINFSDEELMQEREASESDDEDIGDGSEFEESGQNNAGDEDDEEITGQHEETDDSEFEEQDEDVPEVDEEFISNLKKVLGAAAYRSDNDSDGDSASSAVSDETMFRLDESLAAVFRKKMRSSRTLNAALVEQAQQFRAKCFDLLLIAVSHQEGTYEAVDLILPLISCAQQALRRKDGELTFRKATNLLEIILKHKKGELNEKKAVKLLDKLAMATSQTVNPVMRNIVGNVASFLFSACYDAKENIVSENMRKKVIELFAHYMSDNSNQTLSEIVTAPFIKYPQSLLKELPRIIDFAFNENVRAFQRAEALSCVVPFLRKDMVKTEKHDEQQIWKKVTESLCCYAGTYFSALDFDNAKPRFFAYLVRVLTVFVSVAKASYKNRLSESLLETVKKLCDDAQLWKTGSRVKRFNSTSQSICGRNALASLRQLLNIMAHS